MVDRLAQYDPQIRAAERLENLPPGMLRTIIQMESSGNPYAYNPGSGALGLGQFIPSTAREYGLITPEGRDLRTSPYLSIRAAARLLRANLSRFGNVDEAAAAYHSGAGNVERGTLGPKGREYVATFQRLMGRQDRPLPSREGYGRQGLIRSPNAPQPAGEPVGSLWWPGNWPRALEALAGVLTGPAGAAVALFAVGGIALWIGVRNA